jgi:hypothetical protein
VAVSGEQPLFVVGYQRSGTTLLQALLGAHPRIAGPPETHYLLRIARLADYYGDLADDANLQRALHDFLNPPVAILAESGFDEAALLERVKAGPRTYRALFEGVMRDFAERHGKARWCEKTPTQRAQWVLQLCDDARIVHIVRDPRDVVASSMETPWTVNGAGRLARAWRAFTLQNIAVGMRVGPAQFLQVRYEDLTRDPEAVLRVVCTFIGEDFDPVMLTSPDRRQATVATAAEPWQSRVLGAVEPGRNDWRTRLSRLDQARIAAVLDDDLEALGYRRTGRALAAAGAALNLPVFAADAVKQRWRDRGHPARDPAWRYERIQEFLREQARLVGQHS